ncbi:MAG: chemotaxis protein CheD [Pseudomonas sp.]|uniref:chemotaxis protein CheD n=1 Tax=Pseudomonas sp. TaxID=306 RepID=UPI0033984AAC
MSAPLFLRPGEYFFGRCEGSVVTLLGSCVAIILWHPQQRLVGVSHYLLPRRLQHHPDPADPAYEPDGDEQDTRYGSAVFQRLLGDIRASGVPASHYRKGIFGGGRLVQDASSPIARIGQNNIQFARRCFEQLGWAIDQQDVDGAAYRRLQVDGLSGRVSCECRPSLGLPPGKPHDQSLYRR